MWVVKERVAYVLAGWIWDDGDALSAGLSRDAVEYCG